MPPLIAELDMGDFDADLDMDELLGLGLPPASAGGTSIEALLAQASRSTPAYRCLDTSHPPECTKCRPPPAGDDGYALVADDGSSGNKKLRTILLITPEWADDEARAAAALAADAAGLHELSEVLRQRAGRRLVKLWCLFLCRLWHYRSDLWLPNDELRQRKRQRVCGEGNSTAAMAGGAAAAAAPAPVVRHPSLSASLHLLSLESKAQRAAFLLSAPGFRAASALTGCGAFQHFSLDAELNLHAVLCAHLRSAAARLVPRFADQLAWHVAAERCGGGASSGAALHGTTPADDAMAQHRPLVEGAVSLMRKRRVDAGPPSQEWPQSLTVLFEEMETAISLLLEVSTTCEGMLRDQRSKGDLSSLSEIGLGIIRLLASLYLSTADSLAARDQWSRELALMGVQPLPTSLHTLVIRPAEFFALTGGQGEPLR